MTRAQVFEAEDLDGDGLPETPALHSAMEGTNLKMEIDIEAGRRRAVGILLLSNERFQGFTNDTESSAPGGTSTSAIDSAADGQGLDEPNNANENHEVIYDMIDNKRVLVDHGRREIRETVLVDKPKVPFGMGDGKVSENASPEQQTALRGLMAKMTKARLDPKREIKLGEATGEAGTVTVNSITIDCNWNIITRAGGPIGKVCFAPDSKVPLASDLRATLLKMPLPAADEDDYLSYLRQIAALQKARFPLMIRFEDELNPDNFEEWKVKGTSRANLDPSGFEPPRGYIRRDPR